MKKRKIIPLLVTMIPVVSVGVLASCGVSEDADNTDLTKSVEYLKNGLFVDSEDYQPIPVKKHTSLNDFMNQNRKLEDGEYIDVPDDVAVISNSYYTGKIQDIATIYNQTDSDAYKRMGKNIFRPFKKYKNGAVLPSSKKIDWFGWDTPVIEAGTDDSIIYFFDNDDNDGKSVRTFKHNFVLRDSSIINNQNKNSNIYKINKMIGLREVDGTYQDIVPFIGNINEGVNRSYYGSANNHFTKKPTNQKLKEEWTKTEKNLKSVFPKHIVSKIMHFYKTASKDFIPTEIPFGYISYKLIGPNAMKITFSSKPNLTAALIGWLPKDGMNPIWDAQLSIGNNIEWESYSKNEIGKGASKYLIIGKH